MSDITINPDTKTDAEYMAEFEEIMAEIRQHEAAFDKLQDEIEVMQAAAERKAARREAQDKELERLFKKVIGAETPSC